MSQSTSPARGGTSLFGVLLILFVVLKLCGLITWPWVWVLAPLWIPLVLWLLVLLCIGVALGIAALVAFIASKPWRNKR